MGCQRLVLRTCLVLIVTVSDKWLTNSKEIDPCLLCKCSIPADSLSGSYSVLCTRVTLDAIPQELPRNITSLVIRKSTLLRLQNNAFEIYPNLIEITLELDTLVHMEPNAFQGANNVEKLAIKSNKKAHRISPSLFGGLESVISISIRLGLKSIPHEVCQLRRLQSLILNGNNISRIDFAPCFENLTSLSRIDLNHNEIRRIEPTDFYRLRNIRFAWLVIADNEIENEITNDTFMYLPHLQKVQISKMKGEISVNAFKDLIFLADLTLTDNDLIHFPLMNAHSFIKILSLAGNNNLTLPFPERFKQYTRLHTVDLSRIPIRSIEKDTFKYLEKVKTLILLECQIDSIVSDAFATMPNLESLDLTGNKLGQAAMKSALQGLPVNISMVKLSSNNLGALDSDIFSGLKGVKLSKLYLINSYLKTTDVGCFSGLSYVNQLSLASNYQLKQLPQGIFTGLPVIEHIDLSSCGLTELKSRTFWNVSLSLKILLANKNSISFIDLRGYDELECLHLEHNNVNLRNIALPSHNLPNLTSLYLGNNGLTRIPFSMLEKMPNLEILNIESNMMQPDMNRVEQPLPPLLKLRQLHLRQNRKLGSNAKYLEALTQRLISLEQLYLDDCAIAVLPISMFENTTKLVILHLSSNRLSTWDAGVFAPTPSLSELYLDDNKITTVINNSFMYLQDLTQLSLASNSFACNCDLLWFKQWASEKLVYLLGYTSYTCSSPIQDQGKWIADMSLKHGDCKMTDWKLILIVSVVIPIAVLLAMAALVFRLRWHLRYIGHLIRTRRHRCQTEGDDTNYMFDAFIAFSLPDRSWVIHQLLPALEYKEGLRLCIHYRNWLAGADTRELIQASVDQSRKTIVVLTNNFARSEWCQLELTRAHRRELEGFKDTCILVLKEDIKAENQTALIRHLMASSNYLPWPTDGETSNIERFWTLLVAATRRPNRKRTGIGSDTDEKQTSTNDNVPLLADV